ncbi:MAG: hypothetical protein IPI59_11775 [Sphingobacteriales bacterium]|jgi:hypothetical protein|nr:hypothetical protein [Sphingobacteriales bacterium]MBP9141175.1 hypothetical protein [Chitinophagales bacterium]MDA0198149.1 hypothetical protein [Bacteroidota bacterium]MBK6889294.1 hypothetical protein [Sphingobacteriales bacterium]MBK7528208.1 hypothetical protein [Sphingobacteriales bacterium]
MTSLVNFLRQKNKTTDYQRVVSLQILIIGLGLTLEHILALFGITNAQTFLFGLYSLFGVAYMYLLWDLLKNFTQKKWLIKTVGYTYLGVFVLGNLAQNPFLSIFNNPQPALAVLHGTLMLTEILLVGFGITDLFSENYTTAQRIWASVCIYLMIGIGWGSLYEMLLAIDHNAFGVYLPAGMKGYSESIYHSFCNLAGISSIYTNPSTLVRNLGLIEGIWGNLYIVLLIGRVLGGGNDSPPAANLRGEKT